MRIVLILLTIGLISCCHCKNEVKSNSAFKPYTSVIVYKTKADYFDKVPITLSEDKSQIVSYPDPLDLTVGDQLALPIKLVNSFYLDKRGISLNTVFTNYTFKQYASLNKTPTLDELKQSIIDFDPFVEIYDFQYLYGNENLIDTLNKLIIGNNFTKAIRIK